MLINISLLLMILIVIYSVGRTLFFRSVNQSYGFMTVESTGALRGLAIIMIVFSHICQYEVDFNEIILGGHFTTTIIFSWGAIGVAIFFILSGYGCFLSINKNKNNVLWTLKHITKMLFHFVIAYAIVIGILCLIFRENIKIRDIFFYLLSLRMPGSTTWYFKIQMLFYILLFGVVKTNKRYAHIIIMIISLMYAIITNFGFGMADYWWKTSLCFAAGCWIAKYKDKIEKYTSRNLCKLLIVACGILCYIAILKDGHYRIYIQLVAYILVAFSIVMIWDWFGKSNRFFKLVGICSLDIYLIHIGIVDRVYSLDVDTNIKIVIFIAIVGIGTVSCYFISESCYKKLMHFFDKS